MLALIAANEHHNNLLVPSAASSIIISSMAFLLGQTQAFTFSSCWSTIKNNIKFIPKSPYWPRKKNIALKALFDEINDNSPSQDKFIYSAYNDNIPMLKKLMPYVNINHIDEYNMSSIMYASLNGNLKVVKTLVKHNVDLNVCNSQNENSLSLALHKNHTDVALFLIKSGIDLNCANNQTGVTPLAIAAHKGFNKVIRKMLCSKNLKTINNFTYDGNSALSLAAAAGFANITRALLNKQNLHPLHYSPDKDLAFMLAAKHGHIDVMLTMLNSRIALTLMHKNHITALMWSTIKQKPKAIEHILKKNHSTINSCTTHGYNALIFAVYQGYTAGVGILLGSPYLNINHATITGDTALSIAASRGNSAIVKKILNTTSATINTKTRNAKGETALSIARKNNYNNIARIISNHTKHHSKEITPLFSQRNNPKSQNNTINYYANKLPRNNTR